MKDSENGLFLFFKTLWKEIIAQRVMRLVEDFFLCEHDTIIETMLAY